jgi:hypothetical protein
VRGQRGLLRIERRRPIRHGVRFSCRR